MSYVINMSLLLISYCLREAHLHFVIFSDSCLELLYSKMQCMTLDVRC